MEGSEAIAEARESSPPSPSNTQRARAERNRLRALALRDARLAARGAGGAGGEPAGAVDSGGGFLVEAGGGAPAPRAAPPPAPEPDPAARPPCAECGRPVASSYLLDAFDYPACDECRDEGGAHALVTRTEAKAEYLLRDADLDSRWGALRCVTRRNPHAARGDMRLYLRAQVEERALLAWGSAARLQEEREARAARRERGRARRGARHLRALRLEVRPPPRPDTAHRHQYGAETHDARAQLYSRACACGHVQTYEKM